MRLRLLAGVVALATTAHAFLPAQGPRVTSTVRRPSTSSLYMLDVGDKLPLDTTFQILQDGKPTDVPASDLFAGKKVVVLGLPGAFTPTCSEKHLPGFIEKADDFKAKGVDSILCLSVNDCFVMSSWGKQLGAEGKVTMLADGGAAFTKATGLEFETANFGGLRMQRMSMLVEDGVVKKLHLEGGGGFTNSNAETLLAEL